MIKRYTIAISKTIDFNIQKLTSLHEKNDFAEVSKNLARYRSEKNFVWTIKIIM